MMIHESLEKIIFRISSRDINERIKCFRILLYSLNRILHEPYSSKTPLNEKKHNSYLIAQKAMLNGFSINKIYDGVEIPNISKGVTVNIPDPNSMIVLCRSLLESYLTLNYINYAETPVENEFHYKLWLQYGLKNRIKIENHVEVKKKEHLSTLNSDKENFKLLINEIKDNKCYKELTVDAQLVFLRAIKSEWKLNVQDNKVIKLSWQNLLENTGIRHELSSEIYNFLSWYAHTTSVSVFQLREMYKDEFLKSLIFNTLNLSSFFIAMCISDIVRLDDCFRKGYSYLDNSEKDLINVYNYFVRNNNYTIDSVD